MNRPGSVLVLTLLALLLIELLAVGMLAVAGVGIASHGVRLRALRGRLAAESAIRAALAEWPEQPYDTLSPNAVLRRTFPVADSAAVEVEGLGAGRFILLGYAPAGLAAERPLAAAHIATLPRDSLMSLFGAALTVSGPASLAASATIDATTAATLPPCEPDPPAAVVPGIRASVGVPLDIDGAAVVSGSPPVLFEGSADTTLTIAGLRLEALVSLADHRLAGSISPQPSTTPEGCNAADPHDWGDPTHPAVSCARHRPFVFAAGDLTIEGGVGQGLLVVLGTLRVAAGARFTGAVIARRLQLDAGSIAGAVRLFGPDPNRIGGTILYDPCALGRALGALALRSPVRTAQRWWLPVR